MSRINAARPVAAPARLDLRDVERVELSCARCHVGGAFTGTAAFLVSCACGGQIRVKRRARTAARRRSARP